jgi:2-polyprenyl-3-methyl-5-hydroxy-6-metoxy-1,4-benzoquinol methylase
MAKHELRYTFNAVKNCNMCGASTDRHKVIGKRLNKSQGKNPRSVTGIATTVCRCKNCGLIFSNPQPIPFDLQDHYGIPPEEYWKDIYFTVSDTYFKSEIDQLKKLTSFRPGMRSLDIGAGIGKQMIALSNAGFDAYGFEPSKPFYERALAKMNLSADKLKLGMIEEMEYPEAYFDFISFGAVLEHLYYPGESIQKAMKWLKPNGIIHIEVPSSGWLISKMVNFYYRLIGTDYVTNISPMLPPYHLYEFGLRSFQAHAQRHDYKIVHYEYYVCQTFMPKLFDYVLVPYMQWTNTGMQLCVWLKK